MRVLWITNIPFGPLSELIGKNDTNTSGSWLNAALNTLKYNNDLELTVVTVSRVKSVLMKKVGKHTFYVLPGGYPAEYDIFSLKNREIWELIKIKCQPHIIHIWGTEYSHGYLALQVMKDIPSVIYMQGLMSQIARHYISGMSSKELMRCITLRDILKLDWIKRQQSKFLRRSLLEAEMIRTSANIIVENDWCEAHCKVIAPDAKFFRSKLNINAAFYNQEWNAHSMMPYTIMSNASGYPIKGLHILLKALALVIRKYPQAKLYIPGENSPLDDSLYERVKINGYRKYILMLIKELGLESNVHYLGKLTSTQMATHMACANVFVVPSSIENHSSTLIEAMIVGTPCIASYSGGIPEYLSNNSNGLMYRFEEYEALSAHINKVFDDIEFAKKIASRGRELMRHSRSIENIKDELTNIYKHIAHSR